MPSCLARASPLPPTPPAPPAAPHRSPSTFPPSHALLLFLCFWPTGRFFLYRGAAGPTGSCYTTCATSFRPSIGSPASCCQISIGRTLSYGSFMAADLLTAGGQRRLQHQGLIATL